MAYLHLVSTQRKAGQTVLHSWNTFIAWTFPEFFRMSLTISCFCLLKVAHHSMSNVSFTSILPSTHTQLLCSSMESLCQSKTCLPYSFCVTQEIQSFVFSHSSFYLSHSDISPSEISTVLVTKGTNKDLFQRHTTELNRKELIYLLKNDMGK